MMIKPRKALCLTMAIVTAGGGVRGQVVIGNTDGSETATRTWTLTDLNKPAPTVSTENATSSGTFTGAGSFEPSESFTIIASARHGWNTADAQAALGGGTFAAYLAGLPEAGIGAVNSGEMGVDSSAVAADAEVTRFTGTAEAMVLTVDASGLAAGTVLLLQALSFQLYTANDRTDFLVHDVSADSMLVAQWNANFNGSDSVSGAWALEDGDQVIIATGSANASEVFRVNDITVDALVPVADTEPPTPNPAAWASPPAAIGPFAISMTAAAGADPSGVEYLFTETSGNPGATSSGWQSSPVYTDSGLAPLTGYSYTVRSRDTAGNTGTASAVAGAATPAAAGRTGGPPNVVIIYADDLGNADISRNAPVGSLCRTPRIDRICDEGIYFSNYLTHHVCSPSRAGLLTGRHYTEVGSGVVTGGTLDNSVRNIAKDFQSAGYATAAFGKWHNSSPPESDDGNTIRVSSLSQVIPDNAINEVVGNADFGEGVNAYGFDEWSGYYGGGHDYHDRIDAREIDWWINRTYAPQVTGYNTYIIRDSALDFIGAHAHEPFLLYVPMEAVHAPHHILNHDLQEMCNIVAADNPTLAWDKVKMLASPTTGKLIRDVAQMRCGGGEEFDRGALDAIAPGFAKLVYYTMDWALDKATGAILDRLAAYGLSDNTIVVFTSDNGGTTSGDNTPFRGGKHTLWEGGVHVPAAIWWPGVLDANQAPYSPADNDYPHLTQYFDWYPTLISLAGQTLQGTELDGLNLHPHLLSRTNARAGFDDCYYGLDDSWAAVRSGRWKLHFNRVPGHQMLELYDLENDIGESINVAASNPAERDTLIGLLDAWFATDDIATGYMPLTGESVPLYGEAAPAGEILEVTATQTLALSNPDRDGVYVRFAGPAWGPEVGEFIHSGDTFEYDIYIAEDSDQVDGIFCSPSSGPSPIFDSERGINPAGNLLVEQTLPKGRWIRQASGMGEVAPNTAYATFIALHNSSPGYYHFYLDNVVVRKNDGSIRAVIWNSGDDFNSRRWYRRDGVRYTTWEEAVASPGFPFTAITTGTAGLDTLPAIPVEGSNYGAWENAIGGLEGYDPIGAGPANPWPLVMEYGLGSDPTTRTTGLMQGSNAPTSQELGTYVVQNLSVGEQSRDFLTLTFDFNREANDVEIVVAESLNLVDWTDSVVLQPPYGSTGGLAALERVVDVSDNTTGGYPVETTRVTARTSFATDEKAGGFLRLAVRPVVAAAGTPLDLNADSHRGILLEWAGTAENGEFIIERAPAGSGDFSRIASTTNRLFTDTTAASDQAYVYRVRAVNAAGASEWSAAVAVTR
jgi:arylsulfatase A